MATYLLTWNPDKFDSWEDLAWILKHRRSHWSCGARKSMPIDSRVFLLRQGTEPRGIVASGHTTSNVYQDLHWNPERRRRRQKANYVRVQFDEVLGPDPAAILPLSALRTRRLRSVYWRTQMSGIFIPPSAATELERIWKGVSRFERVTAIGRYLRAVENTLTEEKFYVRRRDRKLRDLAITEGNGYCEACEFNFGDFLDGLGQRALQVHHRRQLAASDRPRLTGLRDLAVVCATCHAMIHADPKRAMPVDALRRKLKTYVRTN